MSLADELLADLEEEEDIETKEIESETADIIQDGNNLAENSLGIAVPMEQGIYRWAILHG